MNKLYLLGNPHLVRDKDGISRDATLQAKLLALLAYLIQNSPSGHVRRDSLLGLFWPDLDERHARNALSQALFRLRRAVGDGVIVNRGAAELLVTRSAIWCDAGAFERALESDRTRDALELYRGPFLDGLHIDDAPDFEHWLTTERERLRLLACRGLDVLAAQDESEGNLTGAAQWLRSHLKLAPDDEAILQRLLQTLYRAGDRAGAIHAYEQFANRLAEDLDLRPSPQTETLLGKLRAGDQTGPTPAQAVEPSIAVLPFDNFSTDPGHEYICDGMTEEIITALAQTRGLRVAARKSLWGFKGQAVDIRELARQLRVSTILEGSVRRSGDKVRVTAQLIDADGYHLWSQRYDSDFQDVLSIQEDVAQSIANALEVRLLAKPPAPSRATAAEQPEAHALYLEGLFHRHRRTPGDLQLAGELFEQAVRLHPGFARAHAALAFNHALTGHFHYDIAAPAEAYPRARSAMETALSLNDRLAEAHMVRGVLKSYFEWDWTAAERAFVRALQLDPDNPYTLANYAVVGVRQGQSGKFVTLSRRSEMLDPFWINAKTQVAVGLFIARRYAEAEERFRQAQAMDPDWFISPLYLGDLHLFFGRPEQARESYRQVVDIIGRQPMVLGRLGMLEALEGRTAAAREYLSELSELRASRFARSSYLADIHFALEERDEAYSEMERSVSERDTRLVILDSWPFYDRYKNEPRFRKLLQTVGLTRD